jgi:hypothetical protein
MSTGIKDISGVRQSGYCKFWVETLSCRFKINDQVNPETIVGRHPVTGREMKASIYGHVATIFFNPMHDSLMIMIVANTPEPAVQSTGRQN